MRRLIQLITFAFSSILARHMHIDVSPYCFFFRIKFRYTPDIYATGLFASYIS